MLVIGLMSGTSLDGIDAVVVELEGSADDLHWQLRAFLDAPYAPAQRAAIHDVIARGDAAAVCRLHADLGEWFAQAALDACAAAQVTPQDITVIGSHGQTVWHEPPTDRRGATLQLGCPATIAERTGIDVVSDFRARDMAAGGEGAPLVPWVDRALFRAAGKRRALQNVGGMANVTWLPARGESEPIIAFDTGPGNALIDAAVELATQGRRTFDADGAWAQSGTVDTVLLDELLAHSFLQRAPPKSTGREVFGRQFVQALVERRQPTNDADWANLLATLTMFTARSIAAAVQRWLLPHGVDELIITGGGARNPLLVRHLRAALPPIPVHAGAEALGLEPAAREALSFAVLAWAHITGVPANVPAVTGAQGARILGSFTPGARVHAPADAGNA